MTEVKTAENRNCILVKNAERRKAVLNKNVKNQFILKFQSISYKKLDLDGKGIKTNCLFDYSFHYCVVNT